MSFWKALREGDLIDIVAPAWPSSSSEMKKGITFLKDQGFFVRLQKDILKKDLIYASDLSSRREGLKKAFFAKDSKAVLCLRGGYGSLHLMPSLMRWKKPKRCKIFIGLSDISLLHHFVNQKWNWPSLHGPMLSNLQDRSWSEKKEFLQVLTGKSSVLSYQNLKPLNASAKKAQVIKGALIGGNLITLQTTIGTALPLKAQNKILFFEEVGERPYRIDRVLHHFHLAKAFLGVKAILLGDFLNNRKDSQSLMSRILSRFFTSFKCPVFKGLPCGHGPVQRILPLNTPCTLQIKSKTAELFCQTGVEKT